jgi:hypothetical protein
MARITKITVEAIIKETSIFELPWDWGGTSIASSGVLARYFHST